MLEWRQIDTDDIRENKEPERAVTLLAGLEQVRSRSRGRNPWKRRVLLSGNTWGQRCVVGNPCDVLGTCEAGVHVERLTRAPQPGISGGLSFLPTQVMNFMNFTAFSHPNEGFFPPGPTKAHRWLEWMPSARVLSRGSHKPFPLSPSQLGVWCTEVLPERPTAHALHLSLLGCVFGCLSTVGMSLSAPIWMYSLQFLRTYVSVVWS